MIGSQFEEELDAGVQGVTRLTHLNSANKAIVAPNLPRLNVCMFRKLLLKIALVLVLLSARFLNATPIQVYGVWHAGNDACIWASVRNLTEFDQKNHWIIDRGDGRPSVNLVILSFVHPLKLLNQ